MVNDEMVNVINQDGVTVDEDMSATPTRADKNSITFPATIKKFGKGGLHITIPMKYTDMIGVGEDVDVYVTIERMDRRDEE